jgi:hypothetical protein
VGALRTKPYSPGVFFLLDAPPGVRRRAEQIEVDWQGRITWHPDRTMEGRGRLIPAAADQSPAMPTGSLPTLPSTPAERHTPLSSVLKKSGRTRSRGTAQVGYVNPNGREVVRPTGKAGTDHGQYVYVLRCRTCGHEYGVNGSDIFLRRCPAHDGGAPGLAF